MPDKQIPLPVSRFPLQEPKGPDWMLEMLKCRMAANTLPDLTTAGHLQQTVFVHCATPSFSNGFQVCNQASSFFGFEIDMLAFL